MIPVAVGSGVELRQTVQVITRYTMQVTSCALSTFWKVKMANRSNWVPLLVTVKFKVIADLKEFIAGVRKCQTMPYQDPGAPQAVGGLCMYDFSVGGR
jgi:hypothetical protein